MMRALIFVAELIVVDLFVLAALVVAQALTRNRRAEFVEVVDFARWNEEVESWMAGSR